MSPKAARRLRILLDLPRVPRTMSAEQRLSYRQLKARYSALPSNVRALFCANVSALRSTMATATLS